MYGDDYYKLKKGSKMPPRTRAVKRTPDVTPPIPVGTEESSYAEMENGDAFLWKGGLWIKCEVDDQEAILLATTSGSYQKGYIDTELCEETGQMIPVNIKIQWTKK